MVGFRKSFRKIQNTSRQRVRGPVTFPIAIAVGTNERIGKIFDFFFFLFVQDTIFPLFILVLFFFITNPVNERRDASRWAPLGQIIHCRTLGTTPSPPTLFDTTGSTYVLHGYGAESSVPCAEIV